MSQPKTAAAKRTRAVTWKEVSAALSSDETRSLVMGCFRDSGFNADLFSAKRDARVCLCEILIRAQDWLEMRYPGRKAEFAAIGDVRSRLEREIYP